MPYPSALLFPGTVSSVPGVEPTPDDVDAALGAQSRYVAAVATDDRYRARIDLPTEFGDQS